MNTHTTQTTHCFTLQQLRAATQAGGVAGVSLKAQGSGFFIQIQLRTGQHAVLVTARSRSPRMFKNPAQAFGVLKRVGIVTGSFDMTHYSPEQHQTNSDSKQKEQALPAAKATQSARPKKVASKPAVAPQPTTPPVTPAATVVTAAKTSTPAPNTVASPATPTPVATPTAPVAVSQPPSQATVPAPAQKPTATTLTNSPEIEKNTALGVQQSLI